MFWLIFTILILTLAYYGEERHAKKNKTFIYARILMVLVLSYAIGMCGNGADRNQYIRFYEILVAENNFTNIKEWLSLSSTEFEIGFILICKFCYLLGFSAIGMLMLMAVMTNALVVNTFYRFRNPVLVFFLYILSIYYLQQTNLVRQMLAVAIGLYSLKYVEEGKWIKYLIGVLVAFTIHKSSVILIIFMPFCFHDVINEKTLKWVLGILWGLSVLVAFHIINASFLPLNMLSDTRYQKFISGDETLGVNKQMFDIVMNAFIIFYFAWGKVAKEKQIYAAFFVIGCAITNLSVGMLFIQRMTYYFTPIFCAYLPTLLSENTLVGNDRRKKMDDKVLILITVLWYGRSLIGRITGGLEQIGGHVESLSNIFR